MSGGGGRRPGASSSSEVTPSEASCSLTSVRTRSKRSSLAWRLRSTRSSIHCWACSRWTSPPATSLGRSLRRAPASPPSTAPASRYLRNPSLLAMALNVMEQCAQGNRSSPSTFRRAHLTSRRAQRARGREVRCTGRVRRLRRCAPFGGHPRVDQRVGDAERLGHPAVGCGPVPTITAASGARALRSAAIGACGFPATSGSTPLAVATAASIEPAPARAVRGRMGGVLVGADEAGAAPDRSRRPRQQFEVEAVRPSNHDCVAGPVVDHRDTAHCERLEEPPSATPVPSNRARASLPAPWPT